MAEFEFNNAADAVVLSLSPDASFWSDLSLEAVEATTQGLIQFDIFGSDPGQIAVGTTIESATLTFDVTDATVDTVALHRMLIAWDDTATWNSLIDGVSADGTEATVLADASTAGAALGPIAIDVTQSLRAWSAGSENYGWALFGGADAFAVQSSEGVIVPVLNVTTAATQPTSGSLSFQNGVNGYAGTNDTYLREDRSSTDYSANTKVYIEGIETSGGEMQALLSFDNLFGSGPGQIPLGAIITSATVQLDVGDKTNDTITFYDMLQSWDDASNQTWDAFVGGIQTDGIEASSAAAVTLATGISTQSAPIDVTASLQAWSNGAANNGWLIKSDGTDLWRFAASESGNGPILGISYETGNEPPPTSGTLTFQQGVDGYTGTDDTYIREARSTTDYSTKTKVYIEGMETSGGTMQALLSFDNLFGAASGQIPLGVTITSATLDFDIGDKTNDPIALHQMLVDWTSYSAKTWDAFSGGIQTDGVEAASVADVTLPTGISVQSGPIDVTASLQAWADGAANYGWLIESTGEDLWRFASSESGNGPVLTVSYTLDATPPAFNPTFVALHDTLQYNADDPSGFGSGDPSGVAYVPGLDLLFFVDSEHNESPYFSPTNLFAVQRDGTYDSAYSLSAFSDEPTGIAYNSADGLLYISDDDQTSIFVVDPNNPSVLISQIDLSALGFLDAEDPVFDPATGNMFVLDGASLTLFELTSTGALVGSRALPTELIDPEGLAYDAENDVFFVAGGSTRGEIFQLDSDLNILASSDLLDSYLNPVTSDRPKIKGLEYAPSSDPNDGGDMSLYVANYGNDQIPDGQLFEIDPYDDFLFV